MPTPRLRGLSTLAICGSILLAGAFLRNADAEQGRAPRPPAVVAVVKMNKTLEGLAESKDQQLRLDSLMADASKELDAMKARLNQLATQYETHKANPDSPEARAIQGERRELVAAAQARQTVVAQLLEDEQAATLRTMYLKILDACSRYAETEGIDLILRDDSDLLPPDTIRDAGGNARPIKLAEVRRFAEGRSVLSHSQRIDITANIITMMNNEFNARKP
jgi:Skp family chaperone for outer membrane proteins